jgi:hypothetical protein
MAEKSFNIDAHDSEFASRTTSEIWERTLRFRTYPNFMNGARRHEKIMTPFFGHNLILNKVVTEIWRFQMLVFTLYLHETRDPADPRTGLTLANLQKICASLSLASPGRVFAFLNIMKLGGYVTSVRSKLDARVIHLEPTARFMTIVEEWNDGILASIDAAYPEGRLTEKRKELPWLGTAMRTGGGASLKDGWNPIDPFQEVSHFASVDGGWMLMEHLVTAAIPEPGQGNIVPVTLNMRQVSAEFGGSRSNLRRLLESAYELGLLEAPPRAGTVTISSRLACAFLSFIAGFLGFFEYHTHAAIEKFESEAVEPPR